MRAPLHKQSNSPRKNLRRLYAFFFERSKAWTLVKLCLKQTTKPVCWILKKLWHREYSRGGRLFGIWLKIHRFWRGLVFKWSVRIGIITYTTLKLVIDWGPLQIARLQNLYIIIYYIYPHGYDFVDKAWFGDSQSRSCLNLARYGKRWRTGWRTG